MSMSVTAVGAFHYTSDAQRDRALRAALTLSAELASHLEAVDDSGIRAKGNLRWVPTEGMPNGDAFELLRRRAARGKVLFEAHGLDLALELLAGRRRSREVRRFAPEPSKPKVPAVATARPDREVVGTDAVEGPRHPAFVNAFVVRGDVVVLGGGRTGLGRRTESDVTVWVDGEQLHRISGPKRGVTALALHGDVLAIGDAVGKVWLASIETGEVQPPTSYAKPIRAVAFDGAGRLAVLDAHALHVGGSILEGIDCVCGLDAGWLAAGEGAFLVTPDGGRQLLPGGEGRYTLVDASPAGLLAAGKGRVAVWSDADAEPQTRSSYARWVKWQSQGLVWLGSESTVWRSADGAVSRASAPPMSAVVCDAEVVAVEGDRLVRSPLPELRFFPSDQALSFAEKMEALTASTWPEVGEALSEGLDGPGVLEAVRPLLGSLTTSFTWGHQGRAHHGVDVRGDELCWYSDSGHSQGGGAAMQPVSEFLEVGFRTSTPMPEEQLLQLYWSVRELAARG